MAERKIPETREYPLTDEQVALQQALYALANLYLQSVPVRPGVNRTVETIATFSFICGRFIGSLDHIQRDSYLHLAEMNLRHGMQSEVLDQATRPAGARVM
jgi:hypothetical protein